MRYSRVVEAQKEAQRFIERADKLLNDSGWVDDADIVDNRVLSGSIRRASLDLTRSLSALRRSDFQEE